MLCCEPLQLPSSLSLHSVYQVRRRDLMTSQLWMCAQSVTEIAIQGELEAGLQQTSFQQCVQSEQSVRDEIKKEWSTFTTPDKTSCVALAKTGGEPSYTELLTCMEMARDVRKLHEDQ